ncbi:gnat family protein [Cystoisospora suis]|uniref:Gnat family protein n=1 Tax=Cystoisospora suis TaxID=483139 RepID=A0A2C6LCS7_9APIC|nr:gnat family protein [Cystoisospora suis]
MCSASCRPSSGARRCITHASLAMASPSTSASSGSYALPIVRFASSRQLSISFALCILLLFLPQYCSVLGVAGESLPQSGSHPTPTSPPETSLSVKTSPVLSRVAGRRETLQKTLDFDEFTVDDAEEVRVLLLRAKEYPVKYSLSTMLHFHSMPLFQQLSVVAREKRNEKTGKKGKIVGVAGTALDSRGMANVMMLAVDDQHRRIGLGRELLRMSLEKASLFAPGSKANPNPGYQIERAVLHVWISQRPPLSLYMSTGFTPVELIPDYYTSQDVQGGYEMQLTLPYMPVEDKLRAALAKQKKVLDQVEENLDRLSHSPGAGVTKAGEAPPPLRILPITSADNERLMQIMSFLGQGELEEAMQMAKRVLNDSQLRNFAFYGANPSTGRALGALWVASVPEDGILSAIHVVTDPDVAHNDIALYLFEALLLEASKPEHHIRQVTHRVPAENLSDLIHHWELGFRLTNFFEVTDSDSSPGNDSFYGWSGRERMFEHEMSVSLPWERPEEFSLIREIRWNKSRLAFLKEAVKHLERNPPPPPPLDSPAPSVDEPLPPDTREAELPPVSPPGVPAGNLSEGSEPLKSRLPVSSSAESTGPVEDSTAQKTEAVSVLRGSPSKQPQTGEKKTVSEEGKEDSAENDADGLSGFLERYAVFFLAFAGLLLSILLLRRLCSKTPEVAVFDAGGRRNSPPDGSSGTKREGDGNRDGAGGPNKRPHAKKEGYSQVVVTAGQEPYSDDESGF